MDIISRFQKFLIEEKIPLKQGLKHEYKRIIYKRDNH